MHHVSFNHAIFQKAMRWLHEKKKFTPEMLADEPAQALINETYRILENALNQGIKHEITPELTQALQSDTFIFSGFKVYHEFQEGNLLLTDRNGGIKPLNTFMQEVQKIDNAYNRNYLRAEYNYAVQSAQMAVKWNDFDDTGRYMLQYRTAGDDRVREEHAALNNTTLPKDDPFWDSFLPPNGWNCRCTTIEVRSDKYPKSNSNAAIQRGNAATAKPKQQIFRFNPGKQQKIYPPKHPIFPKGCGTCPFGGSETLAFGKKNCGDCESKKKFMGDVPNKNDIKSTQRRNEYERLRKDGNYIDVEFNPKTGGLKATHIKHNFDPTEGIFKIPRGDYEKLATKGLFQNGYKVILRSEIGDAGIKQPDGFLNNVLMDIKGVEGNALYAMNRANVQKVECCVLYFHDKQKFNLEDIEQKFQFLPDWIQKNKHIIDKTITLKTVVCVVNNGDDIMKVLEIKKPK